MRLLLASAVLLASTVAISAQTPPPARPPLFVDAPSTPTTVYSVRRDLKPGEMLGLHTTDGQELIQVVTGDLDAIVEGKTTHYHAGSSFIVWRGADHSGKNVGTSNATLVITYVIDKGAPMEHPTGPNDMVKDRMMR